MSGPKKDDNNGGSNGGSPFGMRQEPTFELTNEDTASADIAREAAQIAGLQSEISELKDRYLRAVAELENVRKRSDKEKHDAAQFGITRFARDLLNVLDNFSRAIEIFRPDTRASLPANVRPLVDGIEAIQREMLSILDRHGIKKVEAKGQRFDPHLHSAIAEVPSAEHPPGTVIDVAQAGYTIGGRLLREAMVTVATATPRSDGADQGGGPEGDTT